MSLERAHTGIYTELGIVMAKYQPNRLGDHINSYPSKIQIPKLIRVCEQYQMWPEAV
jgi:clathrin heavy chain